MRRDLSALCKSLHEASGVVGWVHGGLVSLSLDLGPSLGETLSIPQGKSGTSPEPCQELVQRNLSGLNE